MTTDQLDPQKVLIYKANIKSSDRNLKGKLYHFCSKELALAANKRAGILMKNKLVSLESEKEHAVRVYKLNRLKMTRELLLIERGASKSRKENFDKHKFPCLWDPENDSELLVETDGAGGGRYYCHSAPHHYHRALGAKKEAVLYGDPVPVVTRPATPILDRRCSSASSEVTEDADQLDKAMEKIRQIKLDACSRRPRKVEQKVISINQFVNDFEWLETRYTEWFMKRTSRIFHERLMSEMKVKEALQKQKDLSKPPSRYLPQRVVHTVPF